MLQPQRSRVRDASRPSTRLTLVAAALVGGLSLTLYLMTLAPTLSWSHFGADGGDLISAAATLGVPHPPGYPVYVTLGHWFAQLPIGPVAYRLNVFSAVCMALAAALTTWGVAQTTPTPTPTPLARRSPTTRTGEGVELPSPVDRFSSTGEGPGMGAAVLAGLAFAAAPMVWGQATIAEVHALNALFVAALLGLLAPIVFRGEPISTRRLSVAFFMWGLGLAHQLTLAALAPLFFVAVRRASFPHPSSLITQYVFLFLLGLTPYLLILPRAAVQPPVNWLGLVTPENFGALITAELYRGYAFAVPLSDYPARLIALAQLLVAQFGWIGLGLIALGAADARCQRAAPLVSIALYVIFALGYQPADSQLYLIPVWLFGAWAIAAGARVLIPHPSSLIPLLLIALVPGLSIITHFTAQDLHADQAAADFALAAFNAAPARAVILTHLDAHTFTLWYYGQVEKQRADVAIIDVRLAAYSWYDSMLHAQAPALNMVEFDPEATWRERLRAANPTRPLCDLAAATAQLHCP
jgi:hypothetical protein